MNTVRIGVMDKEIRYVERLSAYLNRYGSNAWNVAAFTDEGILEKYMEERRVDLLVATGGEELKKLHRKYPERSYVILSEEAVDNGLSGISGQNVLFIYRYQSAKIIGECIKDFMECAGLTINSSKVRVVLHSPVGRCGKSTLAKEFVSLGVGGKWLYVGMEDYGGTGAGESTGDDFLYYMKERREEEVLGIISNCEGIISSPFSMFDVRRVSREDMEWFFDVFEKEKNYRGVLFDMGTALIENYNLMLVFDYVVVPFINGGNSLSKKRHFEELINAYELNELMEKMHFIDMNSEISSMEKLKKILL